MEKVRDSLNISVEREREHQDRYSHNESFRTSVTSAIMYRGQLREIQQKADRRKQEIAKVRRIVFSSEYRSRKSEL